MRREQDARGREILVAGYPRGPLPPVASWTPEQRLDDMDSLGVGGVHRLGAVHGQEGDAIVTLHHEVLALGIWVRLLLAGRSPLVMVVAAAPLPVVIVTPLLPRC